MAYDLPPLFVQRLIHHPSLNNISRSAHRSCHQAGATASHHMQQVVVRQGGVLHDEPLRYVVSGEVAQIHQGRPLDVGYGTWKKTTSENEV